MQPTREEFVAKRGQTSKPPSVLGFPGHHFNAITSWGGEPQGRGAACLCVTCDHDLRFSRWQPVPAWLMPRARASASRSARADLAEWDINILPDGSNLPPGSGKAADGAKIFAEKCALCHGDHGQGGHAVRLIGGPPKASLDGGKTIANYWPYATTLFDFIRRSMPFPQPRSLTDREVYSLVAYLLAENRLIGDNDEMNAATLPKVRMPNRDNFILRFPDRI